MSVNETQRVTRNKVVGVDDILASEKRIADLITNTKQELQQSINEVRQDIQDMREKVSAVEFSVSQNETDIKSLREELRHEREERAKLERQHLLKDIHDRRQNLLFYGITESPQENTERALRNFFMEKLNFSKSRVSDIHFKIVHRLPISEYQKANNPRAVRSIIASFSYMPDREAVYEARKSLRKSGMSIQTDLPPFLKKKRAILSREAAEIREKDGVWTRVRVVGTEVVLESRDPREPGSTWTRLESLR